MKMCQFVARLLSLHPKWYPDIQYSTLLESISRLLGGATPENDAK